MTHQRALLTNANPGIGNHDGHHYTTVSMHNTSEGRVLYQHCICGSWRVLRTPGMGRPILEAVVSPARSVRAGAEMERLSLAEVDRNDQQPRAICATTGAFLSD
jgi:hypothetical protein